VPAVAENDGDPPARALRAWTPLSRALAATGDRWTLSIVVALAPGRMRLTHLHRRLPGISTGVLERGLQQMAAQGLVTRTRFKEMPPRVELELTDAGRELLPVAGALARWGMRHMWSPPREHEQANLDALLRLLPALVDGTSRLPDGSLEALVTGTDPPHRHRYLVTDGRLHIDGHPAETPTSTAAAIHGDTNAWIAALGPSADHSRLRLSGDEPLARAVLASLPAAAGRPGPANRGL
jgi:DNA-binding HxlR family transcriptional regulator